MVSDTISRLMVSDTILAIDAGNTRIKWGVHDGRGWRITGAIETAKAGKLNATLKRVASDDAAIASNVAGKEVESAIKAACKNAGLRVRFVRSVARQLGVTNGYRVASQLGTDR